jgi:hypothetical protein
MRRECWKQHRQKQETPEYHLHLRRRRVVWHSPHSKRTNQFIASKACKDKALFVTTAGIDAQQKAHKVLKAENKAAAVLTQRTRVEGIRSEKHDCHGSP